MHSWHIDQPRAETEAEAEIDRLMTENVATNDMVIRRRTWLEIQRIFNRECFMVWLPTPCSMA